MIVRTFAFLLIISIIFVSCESKQVTVKENQSKSRYFEDLSSVNKLVLAEKNIIGKKWILSISSFLEEEHFSFNEDEFVLLIDSLYKDLSQGILDVSTIGTPIGNYLDTSFHLIEHTLFCDISYIKKDGVESAISWNRKEKGDFIVVREIDSTKSSFRINSSLVENKSTIYHCIYNGKEYYRALCSEYQFTWEGDKVRIFFLGTTPNSRSM